MYRNNRFSLCVGFSHFALPIITPAPQIWACEPPSNDALMSNVIIGKIEPRRLDHALIYFGPMSTCSQTKKKNETNHVGGVGRRVYFQSRFDSYSNFYRSRLLDVFNVM